MIASTCLFVFVFSLRWDVVRGADKTHSIEKDVFRCEPKNIDEMHLQIAQWIPYHPQMRNFTFKFVTNRTTAATTEKPETTTTKISFLDYQHRSHAGVFEFPYLLDVRTKNSENYKETEDWFNANLVTSKFAITTCDAIATFRRAENGFASRPIYSWEDQHGTYFKNYVLVKKDPKKYKILYASAYNYKVTKGWEYEVGTRMIESFSPHPNCAFLNVDFSFGIIKIQDPIYPFPPYTNYMHVDFNCTSFQNMKFQYNIHSPGWAVHDSNARRLDRYYFDDAACTIGLWGRYISSVKHINWTNSVVNYKLKYRIRFVDPADCKGIYYQFPSRFEKFPKKYVECMGLVENETRGVICNHDQGAPIVCGEGENEAVRAILLAGATETYCTNNLPQVFMVLDVRMIYPLFAHINVLSLNNITRGRILRYSGGRGTLLYPYPTRVYYFFIACALYCIFG